MYVNNVFVFLSPVQAKEADCARVNHQHHVYSGSDTDLRQTHQLHS